MCLPLLAQSSAIPTSAKSAAQAQDDTLRARIEASPKLSFVPTNLAIKLPEGQQMGMVSWIAYDRERGVTWLIQRGDKADPVMAVDSHGRIVHSFGRGLYSIPHAIRLDRQGNVWTVDAGSSVVIKFNPQGKMLLKIDVGGLTESGSNPFRGATDIAFASNGRIFITDGYANARILEYTADGKKVREWGSAGTEPGQFHLPHSIVIDENDVLYVADRENGRIEKFDLDGRYLGEILHLGRIYSLKLGAHGTLWASLQLLADSPGDPGWIAKLDRGTGRVLGYVAVTQRLGLHCVEVDRDAHPMTDVGSGVVWFKSR